VLVFGAIVQATGFVALAVVGIPELARLTVDAALWGAAGGASGATALLLLYRALARGPMHVAAPTSALVGAAVPAAVALGRGEPIRLVTVAGLGVALISLTALGYAPRSHDRISGQVVPTVALAVGAGLGLGFTIVCWAQPSTAPAVPLVLVSRFVSMTFLVVAFLGRRTSPRMDRGNVALALLAGIADCGATVAIAAALHAGHLLPVSVIGSLYPVSTLLLAAFLLRERIHPPQRFGLVSALCGAVLIAWR
jgi:drug/metabolite transporter (DMT)-like permease